MHGRNDTCGIPGMHACQLNMFHYCRNKGMCAVADGIRFTFHGMVQETVDQDGAVRGYADCGLHIAGHAFLVINHFHPSAAQYIGRADHNGISNFSGDGQRFSHRGGHA